MNPATNYTNSTLSLNSNYETIKRFAPHPYTPFEVHSLELPERHITVMKKQPARLNRFEILWIKKGEGTIKIDLEKRSINDNTIYFLAPGQLLQVENNNGFKGFHIAFSQDFLYLPENHFGLSFGWEQYGGEAVFPIIKVEEEMQKEMEEIILKMMKEFNNYFLLRSEILKGLLKIFMIYLSRSADIKCDDRLQDKDVDIVRRFTALLKKHFITKKLVADYARELYMTPNYLNQVVKKVSGFTASYHIQQCIILEAKRQALYTSLTMKEVARSLGFNDCVHFSRFFKNNSGMNFSSFKKSGGTVY